MEPKTLNFNNDPVRYIGWTWKKLKALKAAKGLHSGHDYLIVNFADDLNAGQLKPAERLVVRAIDNDTFDHKAQSVQYGTDVIHYDFDANCITYRHETKRNLSAHYDFRNKTFTRYESVPGKNDFTLTNQPAAITFADAVYQVEEGVRYLTIIGSDETEKFPVGLTGTFEYADNVFKTFTVIAGGGLTPEGDTWVAVTLNNVTGLTSGVTEGIISIRARGLALYTFGNSIVYDNVTGYNIGAPDASNTIGDGSENVNIGRNWSGDANAIIIADGSSNIKIGDGCQNGIIGNNCGDLNISNDVTNFEVRGDNWVISLGQSYVIIGKGSKCITIEAALKLQAEESAGTRTVGTSCQNIHVLGNQVFWNVPNDTTYKVYGADLPYKVYRANLVQSLAGNPQATVLENTLGGAVMFTRDSAGSYSITSAGKFTVNKTHVKTGGGIGGLVYTYNDNANLIQMGTMDMAGNPVDDILNTTSIEIIVYP